MRSIYERIHSNYYNEIIKSKSEKKNLYAFANDVSKRCKIDFFSIIR